MAVKKGLDSRDLIISRVIPMKFSCYLDEVLQGFLCTRCLTRVITDTKLMCDIVYLKVVK